ncbi:MAG: 2,3-bisphosphoglycerate-independent phosphoglycerate mutase [Bacteroidota bacterium]
MNRHLLLILDGYGIAEDPTVSAIDAAATPFLDHLFATYPHATLQASGRAVGLPAGLMGNSEVGHTNLGAGRVVYQDITRVDKAIEDGNFFENAVLVGAARHAKAHGATLHLLGLVSDGGVHSHLDHLAALLDLAGREGLTSGQVVVHAFTDGRDTAPEGGADYLRTVQAAIDRLGVGVIGSVVGRYWAMDRDRRWPRTKKAYDLLTTGAVGDTGTTTDDPIAALKAQYANGTTDEFAEPILVDGTPRIQDGDAVLFFNFRADRARQLTSAFTGTALPDYDALRDTIPEAGSLSLHYATFTPYHKAFDVPVAFPKQDLADTLGEVVSKAGGTQLRAAETEKYPHVTFFFNGGKEVEFDGEQRILVASPKVATYDLQPEMSAPELAERVSAHLRAHTPDLVVLNFANPDMVGHTGVFEAAVRAVEAVDGCAKQVVETARELGYTVEIIADHGNADRMRNPDGSPHTAHTTVPVPHLLLRDDPDTGDVWNGTIRDGKLGDIAPTILACMGLAIPEAMTGDVLIDV